MNVSHPGRALVAGAFAVLLTACSGTTGLQTPAQTRTQSAQRVSAFSGRERVESSTARAALSITSCRAVVDSYGNSLTAKVVATGAKIDHATVNASGCDVGIYIPTGVNGQAIDHVTVVDANQKGIFADHNATNVSIDQTQVSRIGNHDNAGNFAPNGVQTGVALYFRGATGSIDHTDVSQYQKNGTAFNCFWADGGNGACITRSSVSVQHSTATGLGTVNYIAQNGFQYWSSDAPTFAHNTSTNNMYLNPADTLYNQSATGYLFICSNVTSEQMLRSQHNDASHNDINYYVDNNPADC
jgi:hypothetical protein